MYVSSKVGFAFIHTHEDDDLVQDACVCAKNIANTSPNMLASIHNTYKCTHQRLKSLVLVS